MPDARAALLAAVEAVRQKYCDYRILPDFPALLDAALAEAKAPLEATITELRDEIEQHLLVIREHQRIVAEAREEQKREDADIARSMYPEVCACGTVIEAAILRNGEGD